MHAAGFMGLARGPAACMNHCTDQFTQQAERRSLAETKNDACVTLAYYRNMRQSASMS